MHDLIVKWNGTKSKTDDILYKFCFNVRKGIYPSDAKVLKCYLFDRCESENDDKLLLDSYIEVLDTIKFYLHKIYCMPTRYIHEENVLYNACLNNKLIDLFIYLRNNVKKYNKHKIHNLETYLNKQCL